jgi:hypothetical protein
VGEAVAEAKVHGEEDLAQCGGVLEACDHAVFGVCVVEGAEVTLLELVGRHLTGTDDDLAGVVSRPVTMEDTVFLLQAVVESGAGVWGEDREVGDFDFSTGHELECSVEDTEIVGIEAEDEGAIDADAVVMDFPDGLEEIGLEAAFAADALEGFG